GGGGRRWARRLAWGVAALLAVLIGLTVVTARFGDRSLYPPAPGAPHVEVFVVSHGYHAGIVLPRAPLADAASRSGNAALTAVAARLAAYGWLEVGWGDEGFYPSVPTVASLTIPMAMRALFRPGNPSVLHVVGLSAPARASFPHADLMRLELSERGFFALLARLDATFAR